MANTFEEQLEEIQRLAGLKEGDVVAFDPSRRKQTAPEVDTDKSAEVTRMKEKLAELSGVQKDIVQELADVIAERARLAVRIHILNTGADPRDAMIKMINDPRFKTTQLNPVFAGIESKVLIDLGMQHPTPLDHTDGED